MAVLAAPDIDWGGAAPQAGAVLISVSTPVITAHDPLIAGPKLSDWVVAVGGTSAHPIG